MLSHVFDTSKKCFRKQYLAVELKLQNAMKLFFSYLILAQSTMRESLANIFLREF